MNVSELITKLKALRHEHGANVEVRILLLGGTAEIGQVKHEDTSSIVGLNDDTILIEAL